MSPLFTPLPLRHVTLRNRIAMAPMVQQAGDADGCATEEQAAFYAARAEAGTGLIIVEATAVEADGRCWPGGLGAYLPQHRDGLARIASAIHGCGYVEAQFPVRFCTRRTSTGCRTATR